MEYIERCYEFGNAVYVTKSIVDAVRSDSISACNLRYYLSTAIAGFLMIAVEGLPI